MPKAQNKSQSKSRKPTNGAKFLKQASRAAQDVAREAQKRLPTDIVHQIERNATEVQKSLQQVYKQLQAQLNRAATKADVDSLGRRVEKLMDRIATLERGEAPRRSPSARTRSAGSKTGRGRAAATAGGASDKPAAKRSRAATSRRSSSRSAATSETPSGSTARAAASSRPARTRRPARTATNRRSVRPAPAQGPGDADSTAAPPAAG